MIPFQKAVQQATDFCRQLYPDAQDVLLEEVEREEDKFWLITVSYLTEAAKRGGGTALGMGMAMEQMFPRFERRYKSLKVDAQTGEVISMKIRELHS
jgi:hypothetical protein